MRYTLDWLIDQNKKGDRIKFIHFWGHKPSSDGSITSGCFSQWWPSEFRIDDVVYKTAEHYMMAEKARIFGADDVRTKIISCVKPAEAKELGRTIHGFEEGVWNNCRFEIVVAGNLAKFSQNEELKEFLINTHDRVIVEASPVDAIWGIGHAVDHKFASQPENWRGLNLLGFALMEVREMLKQERSQL